MTKTLLISEIFPPIHGGSGRCFWELYSRLPEGFIGFLANKLYGIAYYCYIHGEDQVGPQNSTTISKASVAKPD